MQQFIKLGIVGLSILLFLASCSTSQKVAKPAGGVKNQSAVVSKKLGFTVSEKDPNMALYAEAANWIGTPYKYGGMTKKGTDCSGVTYQIYKTVYKKTLHRTSADMAKLDVSNIAKNKLQPGDLVFFATSKNKNAINHVGVFLKGDYFIHASSKAGVMVSRLSEDYFKKTYKKSGKVK